MRRLDRRDHVEDVFDQMQNMLREFQDFGKDLAAPSVPVDIQEEDGEYTLTADLPGVEKEDINVKADENGVEITAESSQELKEENEKYVRRERSSRTFRRSISWPSPVDPESVSAEYENGVLQVTAESQEDSGRDIEID
jgi:HSP20 family protein